MAPCFWVLGIVQAALLHQLSGGKGRQDGTRAARAMHRVQCGELGHGRANTAGRERHGLCRGCWGAQPHLGLLPITQASGTAVTASAGGWHRGGRWPGSRDGGTFAEGGHPVALCTAANRGEVFVTLVVSLLSH